MQRKLDSSWVLWKHLMTSVAWTRRGGQQSRHQQRRTKDDDGYRVLGSEVSSEDLRTSSVHKLMDTTCYVEPRYGSVLTEASKAPAASATTAVQWRNHGGNGQCKRPTTQGGSDKATVLDDSTETDPKPVTTLMKMPKLYVVQNTERLSGNENSTMKEGCWKLDLRATSREGRISGSTEKTLSSNLYSVASLLVQVIVESLRDHTCWNLILKLRIAAWQTNVPGRDWNGIVKSGVTGKQCMRRD